MFKFDFAFCGIFNFRCLLNIVPSMLEKVGLLLSGKPVRDMRPKNEPSRKGIPQVQEASLFSCGIERMLLRSPFSVGDHSPSIFSLH